MLGALFVCHATAVADLLWAPLLEASCTLAASVRDRIGTPAAAAAALLCNRRTRILILGVTLLDILQVGAIIDAIAAAACWMCRDAIWRS
jgi:hypothetical protein